MSTSVEGLLALAVLSLGAAALVLFIVRDDLGLHLHRTRDGAGALRPLPLRAVERPVAARGGARQAVAGTPLRQYDGLRPAHSRTVRRLSRVALPLPQPRVGPSENDAEPHQQLRRARLELFAARIQRQRADGGPQRLEVEQQ